MAELPELSERNRGQIAKRVGVTPIARDSGIKEGLTRRRHQKDVHHTQHDEKKSKNVGQKNCHHLNIFKTIAGPG